MYIYVAYKYCIYTINLSVYFQIVILLNNDKEHEQALYLELGGLKKELHRIDMIDEFAKYAKVERKINKTQQQINVIGLCL